MKEVVIAGSIPESVDFRQQEDLGPDAIVNAHVSLMGRHPDQINLLPGFFSRGDYHAWVAVLRNVVRRNRTTVQRWAVDEGGTFTKDSKLELGMFGGFTVANEPEEEEDEDEDPLDDEPMAAEADAPDESTPVDAPAEDVDEEEAPEPEAEAAPAPVKKSKKKPTPAPADDDDFGAF